MSYQQQESNQKHLFYQLMHLLYSPKRKLFCFPVLKSYDKFLHKHHTTIPSILFNISSGFSAH